MRRIREAHREDAREDLGKTRVWGGKRQHLLIHRVLRAHPSIREH